jgi:hypothetical protein
MHYTSLPLRPANGSEWLPGTYESSALTHGLLQLPASQHALRSETYPNMYGIQDSNRGWIRPVPDHHSPSTSPVYSAPDSSYSEYPATLQSGLTRTQSAAEQASSAVSTDYETIATSYPGVQSSVQAQVSRHQLLSTPDLPNLENVPSNVPSNVPPSTRILPVPPVIRSQYSTPSNPHETNHRTQNFTHSSSSNGLSTSVPGYRSPPAWSQDTSLGTFGGRNNSIHGNALDNLTHTYAKAQASSIVPSDSGSSGYITISEGSSDGSPAAIGGKSAQKQRQSQRQSQTYTQSVRPQLSIQVPSIPMRPATFRKQESTPHSAPSYTYASSSNKRHTLAQQDSDAALVSGRSYGPLSYSNSNVKSSPGSSNIFGARQASLDDSSSQLISQRHSASGLVKLRHSPYDKRFIGSNETTDHS